MLPASPLPQSHSLRSPPRDQEAKPRTANPQAVAMAQGEPVSPHPTPHTTTAFLRLFSMFFVRGHKLNASTGLLVCLSVGRSRTGPGGALRGAVARLCGAARGVAPDQREGLLLPPGSPRTGRPSLSLSLSTPGNQLSEILLYVF